MTTQLVKKHPEYTDLVGAMKPPMLNSIGDKLHDRVLQKSISRKGAAFRPWLHVRMPKFRLSNMQIEVVLIYNQGSDI